jgi:hypothetical protein
MDRANFSIPTDAMNELQNKRKAYLDALRDWVANGAKSRYALGEDDVLHVCATGIRRLHEAEDPCAFAPDNVV